MDWALFISGLMSRKKSIRLLSSPVAIPLDIPMIRESLLMPMIPPLSNPLISVVMINKVIVCVDRILFVDVVISFYFKPFVFYKLMLEEN